MRLVSLIVVVVGIVIVGGGVAGAVARRGKWMPGANNYKTS